MLNKEVDTIVHTYPFPAKILVKNSTFTLLERGCYFLWLTYSKIATTSIPKVSNTINSSYVLIENASFRSRLGNGGIHTLSAPLVSILYCHGATGARLHRFRLGRSGLSLPEPTWPGRAQDCAVPQGSGSGWQRGQYLPGWLKIELATK